MSRAFVREPDAGDPPEAPPERPVPPGPNPVTAEGLLAIRARVDALRRAAADPAPAADPVAAAATRRDLRYWEARLASARVPPAPEPGVVGFGARLRLRDAEGRERALRVVGEDEADPAAGLLSWRSPLAAALEGLEAGDEATVRAAGGTRAVRLLSVD